MDNESIELVNKLILHVRLSGNTQPLYFGEKSKKHLSAARSLSTFTESTSDTTLFKFDSIYRRHGLLELIWPHLQSSLDVEAALGRGMWIAFVTGALTAWVYSSKPVTALAVAAFLVFAGLGIRRRSFFMTAGLSALLLVFATWQSVSKLNLTVSALLWVMTASCLTGSVRAAWAVSHGNFSGLDKQRAHRRTYWSNALFLVLGSAAFTALFPFYILELNELGGTNSWRLEPSLYAHDQVASIKVNWFGGPYRGSVVAFSQPSGRVDMARVVGIPGDQIELKSGRLIRNGKLVNEPYCQIPFSDKLDDFPPMSEASPLDFLRELQSESYGNTLAKGKPFMVPAGTYFVLNDDRSAMFDSRILGPIKQDMIIGRVIFAYYADDPSLLHPKFVH